MRLLYLLPVAALGLVVLNAFFGHLLFGSPYGQDINKYSVYVHLGDEWDSYPGNILFDVTNVWSNPDPAKDRYQADPSDVSEIATYNPNRLQYQRGLPYVELWHEFSDCKSSWQPMLYRLAVDSVRSKIEQARGERLNDDPYVAVLPDVAGSGIGAARSYAQFIPACTSRDSTTYAYSISISGDSQFDVYFVDSQERLGEYLDSGDVTHYDGCHAQGRQSFGSTCKNITAGSGLLILIPDGLDSSLTRVAVSLHES
ncbi:MAG: hypothetical protein EB829_04120 [Nitrosopumilus sp. H8]|nr:MAG: hypothetical protein EB830_01000 [Nitrosopumilus sp. H13]RNJ78681.1 MAG: hypothetical protein EB829_04120 [Nitrosopumilus sp. H8]